MLRGPARRRQDEPRPVDRPRPRPQVRPPVARRRQGRGRDPRPPAHLRRLDARPHRAGHPAGGRQQPGVHARRGGQDRGRLPRRPELGPPRGARPRAEQHVPRPLPRRAVRPLERDVHLHGEPHGHDPAGLPRPHGGDPPLRLHRRREARDREAPPRAETGRRARAHPGEPRVHRPRAAHDRRDVHARGGPAQLRARDRHRHAQGGPPRRRGRHGNRARHAGRAAEVPRRAEDAARGAAQEGRGGHRHRPRVDRDRRRRALRRGDGDEGQGEARPSPGTSAT